MRRGGGDRAQKYLKSVHIYLFFNLGLEKETRVLLIRSLSSLLFFHAPYSVGPAQIRDPLLYLRGLSPFRFSEICGVQYT